MILRTMGCRWNRCTMCGYAGEGRASAGEPDNPVRERHGKVLSRGDGGQDLHQRQLLDSEEMPAGAGIEILRRLENAGIEKLIIETRPRP